MDGVAQAVSDADLHWRHAFGDVGPDFVLERDRSNDEPEIIGRVWRNDGYSFGERHIGWEWSLTCYHLPTRPVRVKPVSSGSEPTEREGRAALIAAWRREEAWRAEVRALPEFHELSPYTRSFVTHGQPTPAKWKPGSCGFPDDF